MYNTCIELIKTIHNTLLDYINKAGRLGESTTQRLISIINEIGFIRGDINAINDKVIKGQSYTDDLLNDISKDVEYVRGDINAINDKVTDIAVIVNRIDDNTTPKTKIKAKNSSKKSE